MAQRRKKETYFQALELFLETATWLEPSDSVWIHMAKDLAKDIDLNGATTPILSQFSRCVQRLEDRRPKPGSSSNDPIDQLDLFLENAGR